MTLDEFKSQMDRLRSAPKWKNEYHSELNSLIWNEVKYLDFDYFKKFVSMKIGENKFAPNLPDFRDLRIGAYKHEKNNEQDIILNAPHTGGKEKLDNVLQMFGVKSLTETLKRGNV